MSRAGKYKMDTHDCWTTWGLWFERGVYAELLKFPKRKDTYTENWPDENGTVRDDSINVYESVEVDLPAILQGDSESDFNTKLAAFRTYITTAGYFHFDVAGLNMRFTLIYKGIDNYELLNRLNNGDKVYVRFNLKLIDDKPTEHPALT